MDMLFECFIGAGTIVLLSLVGLQAVQRSPLSDKISGFDVFQLRNFITDLLKSSDDGQAKTPRLRLRDNIHALKRTTLAGRAGREGAKTFRVLWFINNPFVSDSLEVQQAYRTTLINHFNSMDKDAWNGMSSAAAKSIQSLIDETETVNKTQKVLNLRDASRDATLATMLHGLFDLNDVPTPQLQYIGKEMLRLTAAKKEFDARSKGGADSIEIPPEFLEARQNLVNQLCELFSEVKYSSTVARHLLCTVSGTYESFNPVDLILPAWEAPWRGVFYTLLAVLQTKDPVLIAVFKDADPKVAPSPAALAMVYESLRLYPPIRRIRGETTVDVEHIQRDPQYWGLDAMEFNPTRFLSEDGQIKKTLLSPLAAWMPFSVGRFKCPSAGSFSVRMIAVVVGEILRQMLTQDTHQMWSLQGSDWDDEAQRGDTLRAGREHYSDVMLVTLDGSP